MNNIRKNKCPNCGKGIITFKKSEEKIRGSDNKIHLLSVLVGKCNFCKERIWPKESVLKIVKITKPKVYTLKIPPDIAERLVRNASKKNKSFKQLALEKLSK